MVYIENLEREIFLVEEPYVDLFNYMDENNLEKDFIISSKKQMLALKQLQIIVC